MLLCTISEAHDIPESRQAVLSATPALVQGVSDETRMHSVVDSLHAPLENVSVSITLI